MGSRPRATIFFGVLLQGVDWDDYSENTPVDEYGDRCPYEVCEELSAIGITALPHGYDSCDLMLSVPGTETTGDWDGPTTVVTADIPASKLKAFAAAAKEFGTSADPKWLMVVEYG